MDALMFVPSGWENMASAVLSGAAAGTAAQTVATTTGIMPLLSVVFMTHLLTESQRKAGNHYLHIKRVYIASYNETQHNDANIYYPPNPPPGTEAKVLVVETSACIGPSQSPDTLPLEGGAADTLVPVGRNHFDPALVLAPAKLAAEILPGIDTAGVTHIAIRFTDVTYGIGPGQCTHGAPWKHYSHQIHGRDAAQRTGLQGLLPPPESAQEPPVRSGNAPLNKEQPLEQPLQAYEAWSFSKIITLIVFLVMFYLSVIRFGRTFLTKMWRRYLPWGPSKEELQNILWYFIVRDISLLAGVDNGVLLTGIHAELQATTDAENYMNKNLRLAKLHSIGFHKLFDTDSRFFKRLIPPTGFTFKCMSVCHSDQFSITLQRDSDTFECTVTKQIRCFAIRCEKKLGVPVELYPMLL